MHQEKQSRKQLLKNVKHIYRCTGRVEHHSGRGTQLGYPTANIALTADIPHGVYAGFVLIAEQRYQAAVFCGVAEMFGETEPQLEAYILDFSGDLTNVEITIELVSKIRDNQKFSSQAHLVEQIKADIITIRACLQE